MRGLKQWANFQSNEYDSRIFYRCVDWNKINLISVTILIVASFTDAWIETYRNARVFSQCHVASFTDAWIETISHRIKSLGTISRIFYRCVDWNRYRALLPLKFGNVASFTDAWIETFDFRYDEGEGIVASFTDAWIETSYLKSKEYETVSHLLQMRGLKPPCRITKPFAE